MTTINSTPHDLANTVLNKLSRAKTKIPLPNEEVLTTLFETIFYASLKTEESQLIKVTITFIDPNNPDPNPPEDIPQDRWGLITFAEKVPLTVKSLVKISKAADPWSSSLAVHFDNDNNLYIWGMIDQALQYQTFLNYERDFEPEKPGLFQTTINGIGNISVMFDYELIASLNQNVLINKYVNVFNYGPISNKLTEFVDPMKQITIEFLNKHFVEKANESWQREIEGIYKETISRILIRIQNYQHGGTLLITKDPNKEINIKHKIKYDRLSKSIQFNFINVISRIKYLETIVTDYVEPKKESMSTSSCIRYLQTQMKNDQAYSELRGCIRYISSLSCIDGLVVLTPTLNVLGFGTIIEFKEPPEYVYKSPIATVNESKLIQTKSNSFGTRHQSMIAYCHNNPEAIGFVVSQDGDIRAFSQINNKVIMWENIKVHQYKKSKKLKKILTKNGS